LAARRLYRSRKNRMIWGVAGGLAEYLDIDVVLVRIGFVVLAFANGLGLLLYIVMAIVVPNEEPQPVQAVAGGPGGPDVAEQASHPEDEVSFQEVWRGRRNAIGLFLVVVGVFILLGNVGAFWWFSWGRLWPLLVIAVGVGILMGNIPRRGR